MEPDKLPEGAPRCDFCHRFDDQGLKARSMPKHPECYCSLHVHQLNDKFGHLRSLSRQQSERDAIRRNTWDSIASVQLQARTASQESSATDVTRLRMYLPISRELSRDQHLEEQETPLDLLDLQPFRRRSRSAVSVTSVHSLSKNLQ